MSEEILSKVEGALTLLDLYEDLLPSSQKEVLSLYYRYDLSLGEIAEEKGTSRAAVFDAHKKGIKRLEELEAALGMKKKEEILNEEVAAILNSSSLDEAKATAKRLKERYDDGI